MSEARDQLATEMVMRVKGLKIVTRCVTVDELVAAFWKFCTPATCFIPTKDSRRIGIDDTKDVYERMLARRAAKAAIAEVATALRGLLHLRPRRARHS